MWRARGAFLFTNQIPFSPPPPLSLFLGFLLWSVWGGRVKNFAPRINIFFLLRNICLNLGAVVAADHIAGAGCVYISVIAKALQEILSHGEINICFADIPKCGARIYVVMPGHDEHGEFPSLITFHEVLRIHCHRIGARGCQRGKLQSNIPYPSKREWREECERERETTFFHPRAVGTAH